jgi:predicted TIM-barrel fold metal-dependent hydrolase
MMFTQPRRSAAAATESDRLINELGKVEGQLQHWISRSDENARLFRKDPVAAMRAAGLAIEDDLICELEMIMRGIAQKLK